jgi:hypothetical protein
VARHALPRLSKPRLRLGGLRLLRDPSNQSIVVLALIAVAGCVMWGLAWRGVARTVYVPLQLPWIVSGGLAGLGLLGLALAGWSIHLGRRQDALHRAAVEDLVRTGATLAEEMRSGRRALPGGRRLDS